MVLSRSLKTELAEKNRLADKLTHPHASVTIITTPWRAQIPTQFFLFFFKFGRKYIKLSAVFFLLYVATVILDTSEEDKETTFFSTFIYDYPLWPLLKIFLIEHRRLAHFLEFPLALG